MMTRIQAGWASQELNQVVGDGVGGKKLFPTQKLSDHI